MNETSDHVVRIETSEGAELSALLKVMVMLEDAPANFIAYLSPQHAELCTLGRELRANLPAYLEQQRATIVPHCPLPAVLLTLVVAYVDTTPADMWTDVLRIKASRAKRSRDTEEEKEGSLLMWRSARLRQKSA